MSGIRMRFAIGIAVAAWASAVFPSCAQTSAPAEVPPAAAAKPAPLSAADLAFGRNIALIRGHLLTGDELAAQRDWRGAVTHFGFPREEVYGLVRAELRAYKVPAFDSALRELVSVAKARNARLLPKARQRVENALDAADNALKVRQQSWPRFVVAVAASVLKTAPDEYEDAVQKGRVVRPIGYQTARGYVLQAERMIQSVAADFPGDNAVALSDISSGFAELKAAQPSVNAPKQAAIDDATFQAAVAKIDAAAGKLP